MSEFIVWRSCGSKCEVVSVEVSSLFLKAFFISLEHLLSNMRSVGDKQVSRSQECIFGPCLINFACLAGF